MSVISLEKLVSYVNIPTVLLILGLVFLWVNFRPIRKLPPGPIGLPVVGYLPFLGMEPFRTLDTLRKKYGNVFSLYFGRTYTVILADYEAVKDAFSKSTTLDRPDTTFSFIPDGVGFSSVNGEEWVEQRRFSVRVMRDLGLGKRQWEQLITEEVENFVTLLRSFQGKPVNICKLLTSSISNNIASLVMGKKIPMGHPDRDFLDNSIDAVSRFFTQAGIHNYFPFLVDLFVRYRINGFDKMYADMVAFNAYFRKEAKEREIALTNEGYQGETFLDEYLKEMKLQQKQNAKTTFNETNLFGNIQALLVGGSDTTRTSMTWLLMAMVIYPEIQEKVLQELETSLGEKNMASWEDRLNLPYTHATIMEGQRWKTLAPLNTARIATEDIQICGYDIPKGTTIIANNWALHNDQRYWKEPEKFIPERFLNEDGNVRVKPESYVPFSYGKRNCPGETVAMMEILLYLSAIVKNFEIEAGRKGRRLKEDAILGLTYQPIDTVLRLIPR